MKRLAFVLKKLGHLGLVRPTVVSTYLVISLVKIKSGIGKYVVTAIQTE